MAQKCAGLLYQFYAMSNNKHRGIDISIQKLLHERSKNDSLPGAGGHLHHHAAMRLKCLVYFFTNLYLVVP